MSSMKAEVEKVFRRADAIVPLVLTIGLICLNQISFLLFHTAAELFTVIVAAAMLVVMWHAYDYARNHLLLVLAAGLFWLGVADLIHTLSYKGMGVIPDVDDANLPTQLWIGARWLQALLLFSVPSLIDRPVSKEGVFAAFGLIVALLVALISLGWFPDAYIEGTGLTTFKIVSEYSIILVLIASLWRVLCNRNRVSSSVFLALSCLMVFTIGSEFMFTVYVGVFDESNVVGHLFKFWAFWAVYVAIVQNPLREIFRSISAQQATAERLRESEERFRTLVSNLPGVSYRCAFDRDWTMEFISDRVEEVTGYPAAGFVGNRDRSFASVIHPEDVALVEGAVTAGVEASRPFSIEYRVVRADGAVRWVSERGQPVRNAAGDLRCLDGVIEDITERKRADRRLQQAASVFEHCSEGILITDTEARIIEVNQAFTQLTGYPREEVLGRNPAVLSSGRQSREFYAEMWTTLKKEGVWKGEVWNRRKDGMVYAELLTISTVRTPEGLPTHYVGIFSDITRIKESQKKLEHLASHDYLTNTPNRLLLADRLRQAQARTRRQSTMMVIAYLDLDGFKSVNDRLGHEVGDQLLIEVAGRLNNCLRSADTVARIGGDEFVLVLTDIHSLAECRKILGRVLTVIASPYRLAGTDVRISGSIGVAYCSNGETDPDLLLRWADLAMYQAKEQGRNRIHFHYRGAESISPTQLTVRDRFAQGLSDGELELHYQPKVHLGWGRVIGVEGLIRWRIDPSHWRVPDDFLPAVEGSEHDLSLGWWVLREAVRQGSAWHDAGLDLTVSINLSARHLGETGFVAGLDAILAAFPSLPAGRLELEILETTALDDIEQVSAVLLACRRLGVRFALDDFGTGYSSLENFRKLPVDVVKIDRSFVGDMLTDTEAFAIVEGITRLSSAFRREVVAEGMETDDCGLALLRLGCERAQGYGIARPMPANAIPGWVADYSPPSLWRCQADRESAA